MICATPAFVLRSFDFRETSRIAVFFTRDFGKVKGLLKGIRTAPKKFGSTLPLLSLNDIIFYKKRATDLHLVSQCDLSDDFGLTRGDPCVWGITGFIAELTGALLPLEDANKAVFDLLCELLSALKNSPDKSQELRLLFVIKFLALSGFKPHLDSCVACERQVSRGAHFSHAKGGLLCPLCFFHDQGASPILPGTIATILYVQKTDWRACLRLNMLFQVSDQLDHILSSFVHFHAEMTLRSDRLMRELSCQRPW